MNMLDSLNLEFENILLLVLKPKPQTKPNHNIASQKPVWNRFGILRFFGHPTNYLQAGHICTTKIHIITYHPLSFVMTVSANPASVCSEMYSLFILLNLFGKYELGSIGYNN